MKLSIRLKFLLVMSGLLLVCLAFYMLMSITVFKSDKTQLVYDLNRSQVSNLASEIETSLKGVSDSLELFAQLPEQTHSKVIERILSKNSEIVSLSILPQGSHSQIKNYTNKDYLETYGLQKSLMENLSKAQDIPISDILKEGQSIWNASVKQAPPLLGFGKLVLIVDQNGRPIKKWILLAHVKLDSFLESVSLLQLSEIQVSNRKGQVLVQRDARELKEKPSIAQQPLFQQAIGSKVKVSVSHVDEDNKGWLSAYAKAYSGQLIVTARAPEKKVFKVVQALTIRTLLFGSIVLTLVILAALIISRSLTNNIALLSKRMVDASNGDLETHIKLKGHDETVSLALSFNKMIVDLKQSRDDLEVMNKELDQKVQDRTEQLEIQNQKVMEAQEALLRTTRMASMGEVAGRAAHEVLNPLTSLLTRANLIEKKINIDYKEPLGLLDDLGQAWNEDYDEGGFSTLVKNWEEPSSLNPQKNLFVEDVENLSAISQSLNKQANEIAKDMQFIKAEGDRISKIIQSMRRLGNMKSEVKDYSIHSLLIDCTHIMADLFDQQKIKIEHSFEASFDHVKIDRDEFIQSVTNLMRNSLQSLITKKRQDLEFQSNFSLKTYCDDEKIFIEVEDNGTGVSSDNKEKLFQSNFTTKSSDEGTGLGLSISRRFIRSHDGDISFVNSGENKKTVFRITLPLNIQFEGKGAA